MTRFNRLTVVAIAAAAIAPAAHAAGAPDPGFINAADIVLTVPSQAKAPSAAEQKGFWGMTATPSRGVQLISDNSPSQNRITLRNLRRLGVTG